MKKLWWSLSLIYVSICLPFSFPSVSRKSVWIYILVLNFHNEPSFDWQTKHAPISFEPTILLSAHSYGKRECQLSQRLRAYWLHSAPCHCIFSWVQVALHIYYLEHELVVLAVFWDQCVQMILITQLYNSLEGNSEQIWWHFPQVVANSFWQIWW